MDKPICNECHAGPQGTLGRGSGQICHSWIEVFSPNTTEWHTDSIFGLTVPSSVSMNEEGTYSRRTRATAPRPYHCRQWRLEGRELLGTCTEWRMFSSCIYSSSGYSNGASQSQKKRLLAKAQSECMLGVATKREPGLGDYHHSADYVHHSVCHGATACGKEPSLVASSSASAVAAGYHYVTTPSAGSLATAAAAQEQHIVYTG
jgi:hypothetical protein